MGARRVFVALVMGVQAPPSRPTSTFARPGQGAGGFPLTQTRLPGAQWLQAEQSIPPPGGLSGPMRCGRVHVSTNGSSRPFWRQPEPYMWVHRRFKTA